MLKLILPRTILDFVDKSRGGMSRPIYIIKCINYIMINNINLINEGECNDKLGRSLGGGENSDNHRM